MRNIFHVFMLEHLEDNQNVLYQSLNSEQAEEAAVCSKLIHSLLCVSAGSGCKAGRHWLWETPRRPLHYSQLATLLSQCTPTPGHAS